MLPIKNQTVSRASFIIAVPPYSENSGGAMVLHKLCDLINKIGYTAYIWPISRWPLLREIQGCGLSRSLSNGRHVKNFVRTISGDKNSGFPVNNRLETPFAKKSDLRNGFIAVYPEVIDANPLFSRNVVRWFLYKPCFHVPKARYNRNELFFHYQDAFLNERLKREGSTKFMILFMMTDIYHQTNFGKRHGSCHVIRKGAYKELNLHNKESINIDNLSHEQAAKVFNMTEYCICYDPHTMFAYYAAICGCQVIVVPDEDITLEQWQPVEELRYGLAYGRENLPWAEQTKSLLKDRLRRIEEQNIDSTKQFIDRCISHFKLE